MGGQRHVPAALPPGRTRSPLYGSLVGLLTGIPSPDRPARRLSYQVHIHIHIRELFSQLQPSVLICFTTVYRKIYYYSLLSICIRFCFLDLVTFLYIRDQFCCWCLKKFMLSSNTLLSLSHMGNGKKHEAASTAVPISPTASLSPDANCFV